MAIIKQFTSDNFHLINGDCIEVMKDFPDNKIDLSVYSPPFASMYTYSSDDRDLGNNKSYDEFLTNYEFVVKEMYRITKPGRMTCVHCMDMPKKGDNGLDDFPGDIIKMHQKNGFKYWDRKNIWKEPLRVAIRTRQRALMHQQLVKDTSKCRGALADYLLIFKKVGDNEIPIEKPQGLTEYAGDINEMNNEERFEYEELMKRYENYKGDDKLNRLSQFIWRRYASASWEDINAQNCIEYHEAREKDDDRHVCPLQLDIITRAVIMYSNEKEVVFTPFMGVGSEVYAALAQNRKGIGIELKESYFNQAKKNIANGEEKKFKRDQSLLDFKLDEDEEIEPID